MKNERYVNTSPVEFLLSVPMRMLAKVWKVLFAMGSEHSDVPMRLMLSMNWLR